LEVETKVGISAYVSIRQRLSIRSLVSHCSLQDETKSRISSENIVILITEFKALFYENETTDAFNFNENDTADVNE